MLSHVRAGLVLKNVMAFVWAMMMFELEVLWMRLYRWIVFATQERSPIGSFLIVFLFEHIRPENLRKRESLPDFLKRSFNLYQNQKANEEEVTILSDPTTIEYRVGVFDGYHLNTSNRNWGCHRRRPTLSPEMVLFYRRLPYRDSTTNSLEALVLT